MWALAAQAFWRLVKWVVPWASPALGYGLAVAAVTGMVWLHGYMIGADGKGAAIAKRDLHWHQEIEKERLAHEEEQRRARLAGEMEPPTPADRAQRVRLCGESPTCRDRDQ